MSYAIIRTFAAGSQWASAILTSMPNPYVSGVGVAEEERLSSTLEEALVFDVASSASEADEALEEAAGIFGSGDAGSDAGDQEAEVLDQRRAARLQERRMWRRDALRARDRHVSNQRKCPRGSSVPRRPRGEQRKQRLTRAQRQGGKRQAEVSMTRAERVRLYEDERRWKHERAASCRGVPFATPWAPP